MLAKRLIKSNDAGGGGCTNTVDLYNPFPDGGGVALYQLNGDATDVSGDYDGTASNVTYGTGQFGQAGIFNGSSSEILLPSSSLFNDSDTIKTLSFWVKLNTSASRVMFLGISDPSSTARYCVFQIIGSTGAISVSARELSTSNQFTSTATITPDTNWHNYVFTYDGTTRKIYYDGQELTTTEINNGSANSSSWISYPNYSSTTYELGSYRNVVFSDGSIDQVRIFNRALRPYEVEALYTEEYCTPTIVPSEHFNTVTYTGNGGTNAITGVGFTPDFVWAKGRSVAYNHWVYDTVRGANAGLLPNSTNSENTTTGVLSSLDLDGFTLGSNGELNQNNASYISWNFKAGGAAVTNTDGTITSQVSANTEAGFSIVKYTSNGSYTSSDTIGHGLGQKPKLVIWKPYETTASDWFVQYEFIDGSVDYLVLNAGDAKRDAASTYLFQDNVLVNLAGASGQDTIAYCFAEVEGFSSIGSYVGTGVVGNVSVVTGFEPAMIIAKRTDANSSNWFIWDNKRDTTNPNGTYLLPNEANAENDLDAYGMNFLENGFTVNSSDPQLNANGAKYIYMAFAADPTTVEPSLEDSFNTVAWTGNGTSQSITGVGFEPALTWVKSRSINYDHQLHDSVRGPGYGLLSNLTAGESFYNTITSFDSDGFTVNASSFIGTNASGQTFVAWNWKGAEIPAINSNGSIPSVVSANPAAGFSIVSWTSTATTSTIGHGLENTPSIIIMKSRTNTGDWQVYNSAIGATQKLLLNSASAALSSGVWGNTSPNENVFTSAFNNSGNIIAYCFAEVAGFSKFGSYSGAAIPNFQDCGFEPAFVILKSSTNAAGGWLVFDNVRGTDKRLYPYANFAEYDDNGSPIINFTSSGFSFNDNNAWTNGTIHDYIYMAFANQF